MPPHPNKPTVQRDGRRSCALSDHSALVLPACIGKSLLHAPIQQAYRRLQQHSDTLICTGSAAQASAFPFSSLTCPGDATSHVFKPSRHPDAGPLLSALSPAPFRLPAMSSEPTPQRWSSGCLTHKAQQYRISRRGLPEESGTSRHVRGRQYTNQPSEIPSSLPESASRESSPVIPGLCRVAKFTSSVNGRPVPFRTKVILHGPSRPVSGLVRHGRLGAMRRITRPQSFHLVTSELSLLPTLINGYCPPSRKRSSDLECMQEAPTMVQKGGLSQPIGVLDAIQPSPSRKKNKK